MLDIEEMEKEAILSMLPPYLWIEGLRKKLSTLAIHLALEGCINMDEWKSQYEKPNYLMCMNLCDAFFINYLALLIFFGRPYFKLWFSIFCNMDISYSN